MTLFQGSRYGKKWRNASIATLIKSCLRKGKCTAISQGQLRAAVATIINTSKMRTLGSTRNQWMMKVKRKTKGNTTGKIWRRKKNCSKNKIRNTCLQYNRKLRQTNLCQTVSLVDVKSTESNSVISKIVIMALVNLALVLAQNLMLCKVGLQC